jgi:dihydrolipoamide dehydrogenase
MRFEGDDLIIIHESKEKKIHAKHCLIATGRKVDTRNLTLNLAAIKADEKGIIVNDTNQTSNKHVYAIGDCVSGNPKFTHRADHEGLNLFQRLIIPFF